MGGYGSGRWSKHTPKTTCEHALELDAKALNGSIFHLLAKRGKQSAWMSWKWTRKHDGVTVADIGVKLDTVDGGPVLSLSYAVDKRPVQQTIRLTSTPCNYGGVRWWFSCPVCARRCRVVYHPFDGRRAVFACRVCHQLTYTSAQTAHYMDRGLLSGYGKYMEVSRKLEKHYKRMRRHRAGSKALKRTVSRIEKLECQLDAARVGLNAVLEKLEGM